MKKLSFEKMEEIQGGCEGYLSAWVAAGDAAMTAQQEEDWPAYNFWMSVMSVAWMAWVNCIIQ